MMIDLMDNAKLFEVSARFGTACSALQSLARDSRFGKAYSALEFLRSGEKLDDFQKSSLRWAGEMFCAVDWDCSDHESVGKKIDSTLATMVRPEFYGALDSVGFPYPYSPDIDFRDRFYRTLESGGDWILVSDEELRWGIRFADELSREFLAKFQHPQRRYSSSVV